jgi:hypothetical protein
LKRTRRQSGYTPVFEDWLWHLVLPLTAYGSLLVAGILLRSYPRRVLFVVAASALYCCSQVSITPGIRSLTLPLSTCKKERNLAKLNQSKVTARVI